MGMTKTIAPVLFCLAAATTIAATTATAEPAPVGQQSPLRIDGTDHGVGFVAALSEDYRAAVGTLQAGRFLATFDGQAVLVTDDSGLEIATVPLKYDVAGKTLEITPSITDSGRRLTLTPVAESPVALRDINAQQRFFDVVQANLPAVAGGAAIGAALGFLIGFPAGLFIFDFITIPITTVVGAIVGGAIGLQQSGGDEAVEAALAYAESMVPGASDAIRPAFDALPQPQGR
ncbi:hypothetical protein H0264_08875 [Nocardia huaxiensis]|uniref:DUF8020 domain-containing protein n=1 Tax=Nocardia huaxiensis TaxID=2755382 RepID=A0A7D6ZCS3_9NOCA|nr:hypothetical protein [Nocardia huaxiensis]QLY32348.1 hypothetical protein H0264_08875 [Nocardia huaxiensis]